MIIAWIKSVFKMAGLTLLIICATGGAIFAQSGPGQMIMAEIQLYSRAFGAILEGYVDDVQPRQMIYEAVRGMCKALDPFSEFIDPKKNELLQISMKGEYAGIGAWIMLEDGIIKIEKIKENTAAAKAGLLVGDHILKVDGKKVGGMPTVDVAAMLRGKEETPVLLNIFRPDLNEKFELTVVREKIKLEVIKDARIVGRAVGYLRIADFNEQTIPQFDEAYSDLNSKGMEALIIDLRNNNGGLLDIAVELSERFLPEGSGIVAVRSKIGVQQKQFFSSGEHYRGALPLIVLVNQRSASASEIFSAAVRDNGRGKIVGVKTFGKASVQSVIPLDDVAAFKLTTARYITPQGHEIDGRGIEPDIHVENGPPNEPNSEKQLQTALGLFKPFFD